MGRKRTPGLYKRHGIWHIDKQVRGNRLCESTGTSDLREAEAYLARRVNEVRQAKVFGVRPMRTFRRAATHYLEASTKASLHDDALQLKLLDPFIAGLALDQVHMGTLQPFIAARKAQGVRTTTINHGLQVVRHILFLTATEWHDEHGLTWLNTAPRIRFLPVVDKRAPYPLSWEEQRSLFQRLPGHLARMCLFKVNTGCREQEVCQLQWNWEVRVPELSTSVFIIPGEKVKNREERLVVLNRVATSVIEEVRGVHPDYVFTYKGQPGRGINNSSWKRVRKEAGLPLVRVHDLKHTFGRRLRAASVPLETRKVLLGHRNGDITTHYSAPELEELLEAANRVCEEQSGKSPALVVLKQNLAAA